MPYLRHKMGRTFFLSRGKGPGRPLLFLHGGPGGRHEYNLPLLKLARTRRIFLYDQAGCGRSSSLPERQWKVETFVRELDLLVERWGLEDFHLGGASWGATLALEYYLHKKGKGIRSLIFQSPLFSAKDWQADAKLLISRLPPKTRKVIQYCHEIDATDSRVYKAAVKEFYARHVMRKKLKKGAKHKPNQGAKIYEGMWGPSEFRPTGTLKHYERAAGLKTIKAPTLFLCGQYDEARPETVRRYHRAVKGSEMKVLRGCSHACLRENPGLMLREIERFLAEG